MSIVLQAHDEPPASRLDYWQDLMHQMLVPLDIRLPDPAFHSTIVAGSAGIAQVFELTITEGEALRTPRLIRRSDPGLCKIDLAVDGPTVVEQDGRQSELGPGDFTLVDLSRPARWINPSAAQVIAVSFPRTMLPLRDRDLARITGMRISGGRGTGALVSSLTRQLPGHLDEYGAADGVRLGTALLDLLAVCLATLLDRGDAVPGEARNQALLTRIHAYIENRLGDPELSPARIAAAHHISLRYLYALFETQQAGVAEWIRHRRMERCRRDLLDPTLGTRPISAIAARWGFPNAAHFSRLFRATHGLTPTEFRRSPDQRGAD